MDDKFSHNNYCNKHTDTIYFELVTVIGSDLPARNAFSIADAGGFSQDEYIKPYLLDPNIPLITKVKIGLRYYITSDLILQLNALKEHLCIQSFKDIKY